MIEQYTSPAVVNNSQEPWLVGEGVSLSGSIAISSLDFNFVTNAFPGTVTFTRASSATFFDSAGVLQSVGNNVPRLDYNPATLAARGLLIEEQRTNLITSSAALPAGVNVTITADTFVAPDGTTTGDQILDNATLGEHYSDSSFTPVAATNYTFSAFIKNIGASSSGFACLRLAGDFTAFVIVNLSTFTFAITGGAQYVSSSIQAINNGWYKVSVTGVSVSTVASVARVQVTDAANLAPYSGTGEGFAVWGRQLEVGAFPTSYIPTTTTALTRSADVASVNTLSPWYNQTEGTMYAEVLSAPVNTIAQTAYELNDNLGGGLGRLLTRRTAAGNLATLVVDGGATQGDIGSLATVTGSAIYKIASAFAANNFAISLNGAAVVTDTSGALPSTIAKLFLGQNYAGGQVLNSYLRRITYYPRRLSDAELQALTV